VTSRTIALAALLLALLAAPARADDYHVTAEHDEGNGVCTDALADCTLRDAMTQAEQPSDRVILPPGRYVLTSEAEIQLEDDTLIGSNARTTVIEGDGQRVVEAVSGTNLITGVTITEGAASDDGGGILVLAGATLTLTDSTVFGNTAQSGGGISNRGTLTVLRSTVAANDATHSSVTPQGGGIYSEGTTTLVNSTVSGNLAADTEASTEEGGGIYVDGGTLSAESTTIAENQAANGSSIHRDDGAVTLNRSIVLGGSLQPCEGGPFPGVSNVVNDASCGTPAVEPLIASLADNGGPTNTHLPLTGSPAIDGGGTGCPAGDQRGNARPAGLACDVGAVETGIASPPSGGGSQPPPGDEELPQPEAGESVNVLPKSGTVKVKAPGSNRFRELAEDEQLPVGTVVDTLKGRVTLVAAGGQKADFYDGIFKIGQGKGSKPLTTLTLVEKLTCPKAGKAMAAAKKKKKRRLWGDGSGKFRTKGKHSAATVVGTKWLVEDRCRSTLTHVTRGRVSVRDFVKKKTVIVRAGKKYVAKAKP